MEDKNIENNENNNPSSDSPETSNRSQKGNEALSFPLEKKKEIIAQQIIKQTTKMQKAVNKLVDFFDEASSKGYDFVSKTQLEEIFTKQYSKLFNSALNILLQMNVISTINFKEVLVSETNTFSVVDNIAYSLVLSPSQMKNVPDMALKQSLEKIITHKSRMFFDPKESLFSIDNIQNIESISRDKISSAILNISNKEQIVEVSYFCAKSHGGLEKEKGYFIKKLAFDVLLKIGEKFNDIYKGREEKVDDSIRKEFDFILIPDKGFKDTYAFSPKEVYFIAKHISNNSDTYGKLFQISSERALLLYEMIPQHIVDRIENEKSNKKENIILDEILSSAVKFFENYQDIISETSLIDALAQATSKDRELIQKVLLKLPSKIRRSAFYERDRTTMYYASIEYLIPLLRSVKDLNIKLEYIKLEIVVSMFEELIERIRLKKMDKNNLANLLKINPASFDDLQKEVELERKRLIESRSKIKLEKKKGFFGRLVEIIFGGGNKKGRESTESAKSPEMREIEFYNQTTREIINLFNRLKRPVEIKNVPNEIKDIFHNEEEELRNFFNRLVGDQVLRKIKISNKKIGQIEYYLPFNFLSNPKRYEEMIKQIALKEKFVDIREELMDTLMKEYSTIQGKIKKRD